MSRMVGQDSVAPIAVRYGLDGPVIESRLARDFPNHSRPTMGPHTQCVPDGFTGGKTTGAWC